jgi:regulator of chromosome condensation
MAAVPPPPAAPAFYTPQDVPLLSPPHYRLVSITGGEHHALAVTERGDLLSFGRIFAGRLGRADVDATVDGAVFEPRAVTGFDGAVKTASAGLAVSAAITATGSMYAWGFGDTSQLGKGSDDSDEVLPYRLKPTRRFPATGGIAVAMGGQHGLWLAAAPADDWEEQGKTKTLKRSEE